MEYNEAYISLSKHTDDKKKFLENLKKEYKNYRDNSVNVLKKYEDPKNFENDNKISPPLSFDIETASICDLATSRIVVEIIITPDKLMSFELYKKIIEEVEQILNVPSIKINWR